MPVTICSSYFATRNSPTPYTTSNSPQTSHSWYTSTPYDHEIVDCLSCWEQGPDEWLDLTLKFDKEAVIEGLGEVEDGECILLIITVELYDGTAFIGSDIVRIIKKGQNGNGPPPTAFGSGKGKGPKNK